MRSDEGRPARPWSGATVIRMPGIGGTGVVTASRIIQMAAHLGGLHAAGIDQTGLAQKNGPVTSDVRISSSAIAGDVHASPGGADLLLGFDLLGAAGDDALSVASPERTVAVLNVAEVPTATMLRHQIGDQAEVEDDDPSFRCHQNVGRLDISMKLASPVKCGNTFDELSERVDQTVVG